MKPAIAKAPDSNELEDLGRATLQIVHDLKNQLNGLKLYATFLRKRLDRQDRSLEERQTLAKLIAGLDRAASDMTALVRFAQPLELRRQPHTDLRKIILNAARGPAHPPTGSLSEPLTCDVESGSLVGAFDPHVLADAFNALTHEALVAARSNEPQTVSLHARRIETTASSEALIEWRGLKPRTQAPTTQVFGGHSSAYSAFAAKVIAAHGGRLEFDREVIRVSLPLAK
jgi:light-regulated signal transduction histidine kinase (bacteriophytochrome)